MQAVCHPEWGRNDLRRTEIRRRVTSSHPILPLSERLRPKKLDGLVGNPRARLELRQWADRWRGDELPRFRAAVLSGPPGVGKTSAALALAADMGWSVVEMNASDARNEAAIEQVAGRASISRTLFGDPGSGRAARALILLDEADCLTGRLTETPRAAPEVPPLKDFLQGRYGTIDALNAAWNLGKEAKTRPFEGWSDVPRSPGNSAWARLPAARRDIEDWRAVGKTRDLSDRGGLGAIARLVRDTRQPVVLTVNDDRVLTRYSTVFRSGVARIRFYPIRDPELAARLEEVVRSERLQVGAGVVDAIVRKARGDLRAALNDLDAVAPLPPGPAQLSVLTVRDLAADLELLTEEALTSARFYRAGEVRDRLDAPPDDLLPWIEENIPHYAPDPRHREAAFDALASADLFLNRARRQRVWGLWAYASELQTGGVSVNLHDRPVPVTRGVSFPQFLGEMGRSRSARNVRESLADKVGHRFHASHAKTRETLLPFLERIAYELRSTPKRPELTRVMQGIVRELELTEEEVGYLLDAAPDSAEVRSLREPTARASDSGGDGPEVRPSKKETDGSAREEGPVGGRKKVQRQLSDFPPG